MEETRTYKNELDLKAYPNELTKDIADDYTVKVNTKEQTLTDDDIARDVAILSGKYNASEIRHIFDLQAQAVGSAAASGYNISMGMCHIRPMASGVLMEEELSQPINRETIKVYASCSAGATVKQAMENTKLNLFLQPAQTGPYIAGMVSAAPVDPVTQTRAPMEASEMAVITGDGLKVVGTDASVGVTLTSVSDPSKSFFIPPSKLSPNTPKKLQFVLPAGIMEGEWKVKVTTQYMGASKNFTKEPRTFELKRAIVIGNVPGGGGSTPGGGSGSGGLDENPLG